VVIGQNTGTSLEIITWTDLTSLNLVGDLLGERLSDHVKTVVLVRRFGESSHAGLASDSLTVLNDWVGDTDGNTSVVLLKILQANFQVQLTGTSDNVLTGWGDKSQDTRIGF
jgi:hypothetical protein